MKQPSSARSRTIGTASSARGDADDRGSCACIASPSIPRPTCTTIGRSVREPRAVPSRTCSVASPFWVSYSNSRPPRALVACTASSSTPPSSTRRSWVAASVSPYLATRRLEPRALALQLGHAVRQLAGHGVQGHVQLLELVAVAGRQRRLQAHQRQRPLRELAERARDAVGGEQRQRGHQARQQRQRHQQLQPQRVDAIVDAAGRVVGDHLRRPPSAARPPHAHRLGAHVGVANRAVACRLPGCEAAEIAGEAVGAGDHVAAAGQRQVDAVGQRALRRNPQQQLVVRAASRRSRGGRPCAAPARRWPSRPGPPAPIRRTCPCRRPEPPSSPWGTEDRSSCDASRTRKALATSGLDASCMATVWATTCWER